MTGQGNQDREDGAPDDRASRIRSIVFEFLSRKNKGEPVDVADLERAHPELMPELRESAQRGLQRLRQFSDSERAHGPEISPASVQPTSSEAAAARPRPLIRNYRLLREISSGAQGTVFEAIQEVTGRTVAVKVVSWVSRNSAARFEREVQALAALNHPGVVGVIDRGRTTDDAYFLVMEYVKGVDLNEWVASRKDSRSAQREVVAMFVKIALAIDAAHCQGIIHRDLKPSNIRVDEFGQPRIVDFGLAHLVGENGDAHLRQLTIVGNIIGSIPWISPEQAAVAPEKYCPATDVYSLGVMLYASLIGKHPYPVNGLLHIATKNICERAPDDPGRVTSAPFGKIDSALSSILLMCLAKEPAERFASGGELQVALDDWLAGKYRAPRRLPKRWLIVVQGGLVGLIALVAWPLFHKSNDESVRVVSLPGLKNSIGMEFVQIQPDQFQMGAAFNEPGRTDWEQAHVVRITYPFYFAKTEVTRSQYLQVMGSIGAAASENDPDLPIDQVTWDQAVVFCQKLSKLDGRDYRLPTEAEWEFACRAGKMGSYAGTGDLENMGWFAGNSGEKIHQVAQHQPNRWGIFDMHGNVAEWVLDSYVPLLGSDPVVDPVHRLGDENQVARGGSAFDLASQCRSASREPVLRVTAKQGLGFRVVIGPTPHAD